MAGGVNGLANYLSGVINRSKQSRGIQKAHVTGSCVEILGRVLPYDVAVDTPIGDGDWVYVVLNDSRTKAVVVGR